MFAFLVSEIDENLLCTHSLQITQFQEQGQPHPRSAVLAIFMPDHGADVNPQLYSGHVLGPAKGTAHLEETLAKDHLLTVHLPQLLLQLRLTLADYLVHFADTLRIVYSRRSAPSHANTYFSSMSQLLANLWAVAEHGPHRGACVFLPGGTAFGK